VQSFELGVSRSTQSTSKNLGVALCKKPSIVLDCARSDNHVKPIFKIITISLICVPKISKFNIRYSRVLLELAKQSIFKIQNNRYTP